MEELINNEVLVLHHQPGFGAWTYHLRIPHTREIRGSWGTLKVSGTIDGHPIGPVNLAPRSGEDKIISVNRQIREAIGKGGGETVTVTLHLHAEGR